jgi:hypothetical protein
VNTTILESDFDGRASGTDPHPVAKKSEVAYGEPLLETERNEIAQKPSKNFQRCEQAAREPDYNLLDSDALESEKELLLRKIAQVVILRQKPMSRENRSRESEGLLELTTPVSYRIAPIVTNATCRMGAAPPASSVIKRQPRALLERPRPDHCRNVDPNRHGQTDGQAGSSRNVPSRRH